VPYRGNAPAITDTIGGQVQMMFANPLSVTQHIKTGALRAIAVTGKSRIPALPDVPTLKEAGIPIVNYSWTCLVVASKTPADAVGKLQSALTRALEDPELLHTIELSGGEKFPTTRDEARKFLASERATWGQLIRARKIHSD
jgi:tripartite-type tricarboxylate transporter receptor subunit TctC